MELNDIIPHGDSDQIATIFDRVAYAICHDHLSENSDKDDVRQMFFDWAEQTAVAGWRAYATTAWASAFAAHALLSECIDAQHDPTEYADEHRGIPPSTDAVDIVAVLKPRFVSLDRLQP